MIAAALVAAPLGAQTPIIAAPTLIDGAGAPLLVSPTRDLAAKGALGQDSWFLISHLESGDKTLDLMVHFIRLQPPGGDPFVQAIMSVLDPATGKSIAEERVYPAAQVTLAGDRLNVGTPAGSMTGTAENMLVTGKFARVSVDLRARHSGPMLANLGNGVLPFFGDINYEYALPSMATSGSVVIDGRAYQVTGTSWFDRQWGNMAPSFWGAHRWTWLGISLDNGDRISLWDILHEGRTRTFATVLHPNGGQEVVDVAPLAKGASRIWKSPSGKSYPTRWKVSIPQLGATFDVEPLVIEQESTSPVGAHKYEGASRITGTVRDKPVRGHAVVEMVGAWK
jgi:predicted secreted hydrolase